LKPVEIEPARMPVVTFFKRTFTTAGTFDSRSWNGESPT